MFRFERTTTFRLKDAGLLMVLLFVVLIQCVEAVVYPSIHWTPNNLMFRKDESARTMNVFSMSKVKIVCPNPTTVMSSLQEVTPKEYLYENLWIVTRKSYDKCNTTLSSRNRLLLKCDTPLKLKYYTVAFQQFSATAQGLEFAPGREYYFIATSSGTQASLDSTSGGNCLRGDMKMKVYVCKHSKDPRCLPPTEPPTPTPITPVKCKTESPPTTKKTTTESNEIPAEPTVQHKPHTKAALQSDDPKPTLRPSLTPATSSRPEVTYSKSDVDSFREEPCRHDHGMQPSWSIIIPLLVIIVLLIATNIFFVYQLKQIYVPGKDSTGTICENLEKQSRHPGVMLNSFKFKGRSSTRTKDESGPANV